MWVDVHLDISEGVLWQSVEEGSARRLLQFVMGLKIEFMRPFNSPSSCDHLICKIYITFACFGPAAAFCSSLSIRPCFHHCRSPMLISLCHLIRASFFCCLLESDWPRMSSCVTFRGNLHIWHEIEQLKKDTSEEWSGSTLPGWRPWSTEIVNLLARPIPCLFFPLTLEY